MLVTMHSTILVLCILDATLGQSLREGDTIWRALAERALSSDPDSFQPVSNNDIEKASKVVYGDYLRYLNEIGLGLSTANFESIIAEQKEQNPLNDVFCTTQQLVEWEHFSMNALDSTLTTFVNTYCGMPCKNEADLYTTVMDPVSCVDEANSLYQAYDCLSGIAQPTLFSAFAGVPQNAMFPWNIAAMDMRRNETNLSEERPEELPLEQPQLGAENPSREHLVRNDGADEILLPNHGPNEAPWPSEAGSFPIGPPRSVKDKVSRRVAECRKLADDALITTYAPMDDGVSVINDHFDPSWISTPVQPEILPEQPLWMNNLDASHCKTAEDTTSLNRLENLEARYQVLRDGNLFVYLGRYHIWSFEDDGDDDVVLRPNDALISQIKSSTDSFFQGILTSYDPLFGLRPCADGSADDLAALHPPLTTKSGDSSEEVRLEDLTPSDHPFAAFVQRVISSILDSIPGVESTGATADAHDPIWINIVAGKVSDPELTAYVNDLQTRSPAAFAKFVEFLRLNEHHYMADLVGGAIGGVLVSGATSATKWGVSQAFSALAKIEPGFYSILTSSTVRSMNGDAASLGASTAKRLKFLWEPNETPSISIDPSTLRFRNDELLNKKFNKHSKEWANPSDTMEAYLSRAQRFLAARGPSDEPVFVHISKKGEYHKWNINTNEFGVVSVDGFIRTYYRPKESVHAHWWEKLQRWP